MTHPLANDPVQNVHRGEDSAMKRAVWSEFVPFRRLRSRIVLTLLERRNLGLYVAVTPRDVPELADVVCAARDHGIWVAVWPMLDDAAGRWAGQGNRTAFMKHAARILAVLADRDALPPGFALDLEPAVGEMRRVLRGEVRSLIRWFGRREDQSAGYRGLLTSLESHGIEATLAIVPPLVFDGSRRTWERVLGTPIPHRANCRMCPMAYSSLIEGYSRGRLSRSDALSLVSLVAQTARRRYGERASLSLGIVGRGALGTEASYRSVEELRQDVSAARAAGIDDFVLHDLAGVLARGPAEKWLDAFVSAEPVATPLTRKARAATAAVSWFGRLVG